jgi:hypothetical protein
MSSGLIYIAALGFLQRVTEKATEFVNNFIEVSKTFIFDFQNVLKNYQRTTTVILNFSLKINIHLVSLYILLKRISLFSYSCKVQLCFPG